MNFKALIFLASWIGCCYSSCEKDGPLCATLFEKEEYRGSTFRVTDRASHPDLHQKCELTNNAWEHTQSFTVENGCHLTLCQDASFGGYCQNFTGDYFPYLPYDLNWVRSASCSCAPGCTGVAATTAACTNILQEIRNDINTRRTQYDNLVQEALTKEGDSRDNICRNENGTYHAYSKFCDRDYLAGINRSQNTTTTTPAPQPRYFHLAVKTDNEKCFSHPPNPTSASEIFKCKRDADSQRVTFYQPSGVSDPWFQIKLKHSNSCIGLGAADRSVQQTPCVNGPQHLFKKVEHPSFPGYFNLVHQQTNKCIAVKGNKVDDATEVLLWTCTTPSSNPQYLWKELDL